MNRFTLAIVAVIGFACPAMAGSCAPTADVLKQLREKYGEVPAFTGTVDNGSGVVATITVSPKGTWTVLAKGPEMSCLIASGVGWATAPPSLADPPTVQPQSAPALLPHGLRLL